jgi:uncharacterized protein YbcC (UPF0753/DUF2309 family)
MQEKHFEFDPNITLDKLRHYLPTQAPLKDFVHHNTLHAFQTDHFFDALNKAHEIFGYKVFLTLSEYRDLHKKGTIPDVFIDRVLQNADVSKPSEWKSKMIVDTKDEDVNPRIGKLRDHWKSHFKIDLDNLIHPTLFRILGSYLDQGIALWKFPIESIGFLDAMAEIERNGLVSFFRTEHVRNLLLYGDTSLSNLLHLIVGDKKLFERYLFDQQFAHPGWSGMVAVIESNPNALIDERSISLEEFIRFELLLEIDALDDYFGEIWAPLAWKISRQPQELFYRVPHKEVTQVKQFWQSALEWSYYDSVLKGLKESSAKNDLEIDSPAFQAVFCIDDRECSIRRHVEALEPTCETYGTAGFFNVDVFFQPAMGKFHTKICPAPVTPRHIIREIKEGLSETHDFHFGKHTHGLLAGWILTHTLGFISAVKLFISIFKPRQNAASVTPTDHMDAKAELTIEHTGEFTEDGLQVGFTLDEMVNRLEALLKSIGLTKRFAQNIYLIGHGSSSVNNTHYAGYDCGACSGRPGSVNARVMANIANRSDVRIELAKKGIHIPSETWFIGTLHDTSRDEFHYFDTHNITSANVEPFEKHQAIFHNALDMNAKERSRRFEATNSRKSAPNVHHAVKIRTVSLFEPRPELNHATNALAIVGRRDLTRNLFLDRRSFLNSYDCTQDPDGNYLLGILNAVAPVCGGINLEYYFSRVDNQNLGAGTKLPHNVMGLIGVANGIEGDLRTGLPSQMIEVHDPLRLMAIVEHHPDVVLRTIQKNPKTYEWFQNEWVKLAVITPDQKEIFIFSDETFVPYLPTEHVVPQLVQPEHVFERTLENIPVSLLNN